MKKLSNTEAELKKSIAYKKKVYYFWFSLVLIVFISHMSNFSSVLPHVSKLSAIICLKTSF